MSEQFKINAKTQSLSDRIRAAKPEGGFVDKNGTLKDNDLFRTIATQDNRNVDQMISDDEYRSDFVAGLHHAMGLESLDHKKANKEVNTVSGTFEIGRNKIELSFERHSRVPNRVMDNGVFKVDGEKDLWGDSTVKLKVRGAQNSKGELKAVREFISDSYRSAFSS